LIAKLIAFFKETNPMFHMLTERDDMGNLYRGPSIDASYQVSVHLAKWFQRTRFKCEKLTEDERRTTDAK